MKKLMISLMLIFAIGISANAMSRNDARSIALFLTDKMAYELNLTSEQYQAAYEVNYDYFLNIGSNSDLYGNYWTRRNLDLSYILGVTKYARFKGQPYFYRPAYWNNNRFGYRIYTHYSNRNKFYFNQPKNYSNYNSEHSWKANNDRSYFKGKDLNNGNGMRSSMRNGNNRNGMGSNNNRQMNNGNNQMNGRNSQMNNGNNRMNSRNDQMTNGNSNRSGNNEKSNNRTDQHFGNGNSQNGQNTMDKNQDRDNR